MQFHLIFLQFRVRSGRKVNIYILTSRDMLYTIAVILVILWLLGRGFKIGGDIIHILLVIAVIVVLLRIIRGEKPL